MPALLILAVTFLLMWVLFILPQQRRVKAHQAVLTRLQVGDEVMTTSGLYGTITELDDDVVSLELAPGTVVRSARAAVARRLAEELAGPDGADAETPADPPAAAARPAGTAADRAVAAADPTDP
jgi:preprotein translocase subunit YajC